MPRQSANAPTKKKRDETTEGQLVHRNVLTDWNQGSKLM